MKYTYEQRLDIGRQIYEGELTRFQAAEKYDINDNTARNYMWMYRDSNNLPPKRPGRTPSKQTDKTSVPKATPIDTDTLEAYQTMSKDELIQELIKAKIQEARLKKGYEVKGDGSVIQYSSKNIK